MKKNPTKNNEALKSILVQFYKKVIQIVCYQNNNLKQALLNDQEDFKDRTILIWFYF